MSDRERLKELDEQIARLRPQVKKWINSFFWHRGVIAGFVSEFEKGIENLSSSDLTSSEMRKKVLDDYLSKLNKAFVSEDKISESRTTLDYLRTLIDRRDLALRLRIPADAKWTSMTTANSKRTIKISVRWTSRDYVDKNTLMLLALSFCNYYRQRDTPFEYSAKSIKEFNGVCAVHLFQRGATAEFPGTGIRIHELLFIELDRVLPPLQGPTLPPERPGPSPPSTYVWGPGPKIPYAIRFHAGGPDATSGDQYFELLYDTNVEEDIWTFIIEKERYVHIESDLGPEASIVWKYDVHQVKSLKGLKLYEPVFRDNDTFATAYWGHMPEGINREFKALAQQICTEEHPWTGKKLPKPTLCHFEAAPVSCTGCC